MISKCICKHSIQDKLNGFQNRVFTPLLGRNKDNYKCSVCGRTKYIELKKSELPKMIVGSKRKIMR